MRHWHAGFRGNSAALMASPRERVLAAVGSVGVPAALEEAHAAWHEAHAHSSHGLSATGSPLLVVASKKRLPFTVPPSSTNMPAPVGTGTGQRKSKRKRMKRPVAAGQPQKNSARNAPAGGTHGDHATAATKASGHDGKQAAAYEAKFQTIGARQARLARRRRRYGLTSASSEVSENIVERSLQLQP